MKEVRDLLGMLHQAFPVVCGRMHSIELADRGLCVHVWVYPYKRQTYVLNEKDLKKNADTLVGEIMKHVSSSSGSTPVEKGHAEE